MEFRHSRSKEIKSTRVKLQICTALLHVLHFGEHPSAKKFPNMVKEMMLKASLH
ncbi:MAG: hypothetical protein WAM14_24065 [Candidatus Nitrosopolaris sp.]